jgi:hypothetical protein
LLVLATLASPLLIKQELLTPAALTLLPHLALLAAGRAQKVAARQHVLPTWRPAGVVRAHACSFTAVSTGMIAQVAVPVDTNP